MQGGLKEKIQHRGLHNDRQAKKGKKMETKKKQNNLLLLRPKGSTRDNGPTRGSEKNVTTKKTVRWHFSIVDL